MDKEDLHILRLMGEIDRDGDHSQRELSQRLDLSLGLVNTFLKRLVTKGYSKVTTLPKNRLKYFLTPEGIARKSKLTVEYLHYSMNFYRDIKHLLLKKYQEMEANKVQSILFWGAGEVADLAYLYLQQTNIQLAGIIDDEKQGKKFFNFKIDRSHRVRQLEWDMVFVTRLDDIEEDIKRLHENGITQERIATL
jgi:DNA-binding MarR family transcriptional regulator